jgi:hypothetical protein
MLFSIKSGKFIILTQKEFKTKKFVNYDIYKCKIKPSSDINKNKLFRFSKVNKYTHIDINSAIEEKFEIKMIEDGNSNMLYYSRNCLIQGHLLFKPFVDYLFDLKKKKVPGSKDLLNALWGTLTQSNIITINCNIIKGLNLRKNQQYIEIEPNENDPTKFKAKIIENNQIFETDFARIKPFMLAKGRYVLKKHAKPFVKDIKYMHTDSMITSVKLDIKTGDDLEKLKYEGFAENYSITYITKKDSKTNFKLSS